MIKINKKKPIKVGNSNYFSIPKRYINDGNIKQDQEYDLEVNESKK